MTNNDLAKYPATKWITADPDGYWHLGLRKELRTRTGKLMSAYYATACSGRKLGGPWGQTERDETPKGAGLCPRCAAIAKKRQAARDSTVPVSEDDGKTWRIVADEVAS